MEDYEELKVLFNEFIPMLMRGGLELSRDEVLIQPSDKGWRISVALCVPTAVVELRRFARSYLKEKAWKLETILADGFVLSFYVNRVEIAPRSQHPARRTASSLGRQDHLRRQTPVPATTRSSSPR